MPEPLEPARPAAALGAGRLADFAARVRGGDDPPALIALLLVVAVLAGVFWYRAGLGGGGVEPAGAAAPPAAGPAATAAAGGTSTTIGVVVVHVAGAVARPGLYRLPAGSRVADAVDAAGGGGDRADVDRLNLAGRLVDGQRVAVPRHGEPMPVAADVGAAAAGAADGAGVPAEPVDLNTAGATELEALPGVGPATARAILAERARRNGFRSVRDLLRVPGIGERRFAELRDRVRV